MAETNGTILIAGLRRSGTTLVQEMLSNPPISYIFHEPQFHYGYIQNPKYAEDALKGIVDLREIAKKVESWKEFLHELSKHLIIGVKEVQLSGVSEYLDILNKPKTVLIGRDPRDIYVSHREYMLRVRGQPNIDDNEFYEDIIKDVYGLLNLARLGTNHYPVKYEDICNNALNYQISLNKHCGMAGMGGRIGEVHEVLVDRGEHELNIHQRKITAKRIGIWKTSEHRQRAERFYDRMDLYRSLWGYDTCSTPLTNIKTEPIRAII